MLVPRSAKTPGVPDKGLAQQFATPCQADQRFCKTGNIESFQCSTVLEKLKHIVKEPSIRVTQLCPVTQLCAMKHRLTHHCCIFIRNSPILSGTTGDLFGTDIIRRPFDAKFKFGPHIVEDSLILDGYHETRLQVFRSS